MTGIPEYRGLANQDVRPLRSTPSASAARDDGKFVISVEEMRRDGLNISTGGGDGAEPGAGGGPQAGPPAAIARGVPAGTAAASPLRGEPYVPKAWLRAQNGNGLSEEEKAAKLRKIRESAQEYEGLLVAEMIKLMRQKPMAKTPGSDTLSEIAEKPFTAALMAAGGLGLADRIVEDVAAQEGLAGTLEAHPEIMGPGWRARIAPSRRYKPVNLGGPGASGAGDPAADAPGRPSDPQPASAAGGGHAARLRRAPDLPQAGGSGIPPAAFPPVSTGRDLYRM
ncbi:MAG: hypothetical protein LBG06_11360 [Deltaproteobacteria bacterium]|nr:hypothetical protein [Deltaproteobacteria bacterium]